MKIKLTIIALFLSAAVYGQAHTLFIEPDTVAKPNYKYLILYRQHESFMTISGGNAGTSRQYVTKHAAFETSEKMKLWLNNEWNGRKDITIPINTILGIYDLTTAKQIPFELKEQHQIRPRRVEIERDEWTDRYYELKF